MFYRLGQPKKNQKYAEIDWSGTSVTAKAWFRTNLNNGYYNIWFKCNNVTIKDRTSGVIGKILLILSIQLIDLISNKIYSYITKIKR